MSMEPATFRATSHTGRDSRGEKTNGKRNGAGGGRIRPLLAAAYGFVAVTSFCAYFLNSNFLNSSADQIFQGDAIRDHQGRAGLLDEALLLEAREKSADGFTGRADHLSDLFVSQNQLHLAWVLGCGVLIEPSHQQAGEFLAGRIGEDEIADLAASGGIVAADVLGYPEGKFTVLAHEAQQIALTQEADLGGLLGFRSGFVLTPGDYRGNAHGATGIDNAQDQRSAVAAANGELHPAAADDEHAARCLPFGEQNRSGRIGSGEGFLFQGIGYNLREIAN